MASWHKPTLDRLRALLLLCQRAHERGVFLSTATRSVDDKPASVCTRESNGANEEML